MASGSGVASTADRCREIANRLGAGGSVYQFAGRTTCEGATCAPLGCYVTPWDKLYWNDAKSGPCTSERTCILEKGKSRVASLPCCEHGVAHSSSSSSSHCICMPHSIFEHARHDLCAACCPALPAKRYPSRAHSVFCCASSTPTLHTHTHTHTHTCAHLLAVPPPPPPQQSQSRPTGLTEAGLKPDCSSLGPWQPVKYTLGHRVLYEAHIFITIREFGTGDAFEKVPTNSFGFWKREASCVPGSFCKGTQVAPKSTCQKECPRSTWESETPTHWPMWEEAGTNCLCGKLLQEYRTGADTAELCASRCTANPHCLSFGVWTKKQKGACRLYSAFVSRYFPTFLPHFRLYEVASLHMRVLPYK